MSFIKELIYRFRGEYTTEQLVSMGMKVGKENEYGIITENNEEALYEGIKKLLDTPELLAHYKQKVEERGKFFSTENTVKAVEEMLCNLSITIGEAE